MQKRLIIIGASLIVGLAIFFLIIKLVGINTTAPKVSSTINMDEESLLLERARKAQGSGEFLKAKEIYQRIIEKFPASNNIAKVQEALYDTNIKILFSPVATSDSLVYEVQKGDTLNKIAKKFNTTPELISRTNGLKDTTVRIGKRLKISKAIYAIIVDKSQNILTLKSDGNILKTYIVSCGKNSSTPTGTFKVINKVIDPPWYPSAGGVIPTGDPKNVLGSRWIGISKQGYGIHGTTEPESIGKSVTEGCVRMRNPDVEELYSIIPEGTEVVIVD